MNYRSKTILAVILPLLFFFLIVLSLPFGSSSSLAAGEPPQVIQTLTTAARQTLPPVPILADNLGDSSKIFAGSGNLKPDSSFPEQMDGDLNRIIPMTDTAEAWLIWVVEADGSREFQAATYHLVDRPIVDFKFYVSSDNQTYTEISPTVKIPSSNQWTRVRYSFVPPAGMNFVKVEFPDGPVTLNPRQLGAISFNEPIPIIYEVTPSSGPSNVPVTLDIYGENFTPRSMGYLIPMTDASMAVALENTLYADAYHLQVILPVTLTLQKYNVKVVNPAGSETSHIGAYKVLDGTLYDDLTADELDLLIDPLVFLEGDTTNPNLFLTVRRWGGKTPLSNVKVKFYEGDPDAGGILLGTGVASSLDPYSHTLTSPVVWPLFSGGQYTLYAKIDPDNAIAEANEANNVISRTVTIEYLPPESDTLPPQVDSFVINDSAPITGERSVVLKTTASDSPTGSAVVSVLYLEYVFVQSAGDWLPVGFSDSDEDGTPDWLPYDGSMAVEGYPWTLTPTPGIHYLAVWVADAYGNVSVVPGTAFINLMPSPDSSMHPATILQDAIHIYRVNLGAGENVSVELVSVIGDADLYVWGPDGSAVGIQETSNPSEVVGFTAAVAGTYQIEVAGFTNAE
ncbi:MAG: pre-peptidase C-terminal domain-containing protein, partial [Ardenticatenales bacterium]|nr:pre-peptidase C-terminal domain-containing protein [Ardenticatenales bacterium]